MNKLFIIFYIIGFLIILKIFVDKSFYEENKKIFLRVFLFIISVIFIRLFYLHYKQNIEKKFNRRFNEELKKYI